VAPGAVKLSACAAYRRGISLTPFELLDAVRVAVVDGAVVGVARRVNRTRKWVPMLYTNVAYQCCYFKAV